MTVKLVRLIVMLFVLAGCVADVTPSPLPEAVIETPVPTDTISPSITPPPTSTPTLTPTPQPITISSENANKLQNTRIIGDGIINDFEFSPDGSRLLVLMSTGLKLFNTVDGTIIWSTPINQTHSSATFSEDGDTIYTYNGGGLTQSWSVETGQAVEQIFNPVNDSVGSMISQNSKRILIGLSSRLTKIFDLASGALISENNGRSAPYGIQNASISPDGSKYIISGNISRTEVLPQVWDTETGKYLFGMTAGKITLFDFNFYQDNNYVAAIGNKIVGSTVYTVIMSWRMETGLNELLIELEGNSNNIEITPDGVTAFLTFTNNNKIAVVDLETAKAERQKTIDSRSPADKSMVLYQPQWLDGNTADIISIELSPDGKVLAAMDYDGTIMLWDTSTRNKVSEIHIQVSDKGKYSYGIAISKDAKIVARTTPKLDGVELVNITDGQIIKELETDERYYYSALSFSYDGKKLAGRRYLTDPKPDEDANEEIVLWDIQSGSIINTFPAERRFSTTSTYFSPDDRMIFTLGYGQIVSYDPDKGEKIHEYGGYSEISFSPDSSNLAYDSVDRTELYISSVESGKLISSVISGYIYALSYSPDGNNIAIGCSDVKTWATSYQDRAFYIYYISSSPPYKTSNLPRITDVPNVIRNLVFSPDGVLLAFTDTYGDMFIYEVSSGKQLLALPSATLSRDLVFSPDMKSLISVNSDGTARIFEVK